MIRTPTCASMVIGVALLLAACEDGGSGGDEPAAHEFVIEPDAATTSLTLTHPDFPSVRLTGLSPALYISGEAYGCTDYPERTLELTSALPSWRLTCKGHDVAPDLWLDIERIDETALELRASTKGSLTNLRGFDVLATEGGLDLGGGAVAQLSNGFQSWSNSGVIRVPESPPRDGLEPLLAERGDEEVMREGRHLSWWLTALAADHGPTLVAGSTTARLFKTSVAAYGKAKGERGMVLRLISGLAGESIDAAECEEVESETFRIVLGEQSWDTLQRYSEALGPSRAGTGPGALGWNSWYEHWWEVSADDIRGSAAIAAERLANQGEDFVVVVDDGWELQWGDWQANERFPDGMAALAAELKAQGLTPGLWLAPLLVDQDNALAAEHPDWFVRGASGELLYYPHLIEGRQLILDVTHPEAAAFLEDLMQQVVGWGFEVLKLDFLFAGAYEGQRQARVSGTQAYSLALQTLRAGMGQDTYFLACGAPLLGGPRPLAYDAIRSGADIAYQPTGLAWSFVTTEIRNTAARSFLHGNAVAVDADPPLVRPPFTEDEAWAMVVSVLVSGGLLFSSDALPALPEERLNLLQHPAIAHIRGLPGPAAEPVDLLAGKGLPEYLVSPYEDYVWSQGFPGQSQSVQPWLWRWDDGAGGLVLAMFAFGPEGRSVDLALADLGLDAAANVTTLGPGPAATLASGRLQVELAGHQAVLVHVTP